MNVLDHSVEYHYAGTVYAHIDGDDQQVWMTMPPGEEEAMYKLKQERIRLEGN